MSRRYFSSGGLLYSSGNFIGTSITLGARPGVTLAEAVPYLVGISKRYVPSRNSGVASDTSTQMLARFGADVLAYGPAMVSIEAGFNDPGGGINSATTQANITAMTLAAQRAGAKVTLWVPTYTSEEPLNTDLQPYRTVVRNLIVSLNTFGFDTYNDFVALSPATQTSYFQPGDGQHFSPAGLAWLASLPGSGSYVNSFVAATHPSGA